MLDLRLFREEPDRVREGLARRGLTEAESIVAEVARLDECRRAAISEANALKARRNEVSKQIGERKRRSEDASDWIAEMRRVGVRIAELDREVAAQEARIQEILLNTANLPLPEVQPGGPEANQVVRVWGERRDFSFEPRPHWELGAALDILDLPRGAKVAGSGFPLLKGAGARLQRAMIDFMLDVHTREHGYVELRPPYLVSADSMVGTGQLPKYHEESYFVDRDGLWLIPTAEVPVTNLHRDELLAPGALPVRYVAYSPCFRREAGAAGADTRGLLRVHQFDKVELVRYEPPKRSRQALEELTNEAEKILRRLGLHYRVVRLAAGDLGFSGAMTYDLEVWAPGVKKWLEVSSCTTFGDYQARRANLRFRPEAGAKPEFVHTLNGSGVALARTVVAVLERGQQADGSIVIPEVLWPYAGFEGIGP
ncbi:MAG: serine--tRNA ligase [Gemmatimonadetes bacterium]|nr:serine--tRNA ligase [Gemmatimonadota bacterium]